MLDLFDTLLDICYCVADGASAGKPLRVVVGIMAGAFALVILLSIVIAYCLGIPLPGKGWFYISLIWFALVVVAIYGLYPRRD